MLVKHPNPLAYPRTINFSSTQSGMPQGDKPLEDAIFTVIDCEMTGLSTTSDELTEVTAITYKNGQELSKFSTLVKPNKRISEKIEKLTGITNEMVQNAPSQRQVLEKLCDFLSSSPLLVGDFIDVDIQFLTAMLKKQGMSHETFRFRREDSLCTRTLASVAIDQLNDRQITSLLGHKELPAHRAENDVKNAASFLFRLIKILKAQPNKPVKTVMDLKSFQGEAAIFKGF